MIMKIEYYKKNTYNIYQDDGSEYIIPLTEDNVELRIHKLSKEEFEKLDESTCSYKWYGTYFDRKKKIDKKCPVHRKDM